MGIKAGEFFIEMAVDAATGNLSVKQLVSSLGELNVTSVASVGVLGKVADSIWGVARAATQTSVEMSALHDIAGVDPKMVQQWEKAAERVVHHSGSIVSAIKSVQEMNRGIASNQPPPAVLTGILGLTPYKKGPDGNPALKDSFDYLKEMAAAGSTYRTRSRDVQQGALGQLFPGAGEDMYRVLNDMIAGKFHPEKIPVLNDQQVGQLNSVDAQWISVKQDVVGIFEKFLLAGGDVAKILEGTRRMLEMIDRFMDAHKHHSYIEDIKNISRGIYSNSGMGEAFEQQNRLAILQAMGGKMPIDDLLSAGAPRIRRDSLGTGELRGKLDINLLRDGKPLGTRQTYVDRAGTMREFWNVTDQLGNTP